MLWAPPCKIVLEAVDSTTRWKEKNTEGREEEEERKKEKEGGKEKQIGKDKQNRLYVQTNSLPYLDHLKKPTKATRTTEFLTVAEVRVNVQNSTYPCITHEEQLDMKIK